MPGVWWFGCFLGVLLAISKELGYRWRIGLFRALNAGGGGGSF